MAKPARGVSGSQPTQPPVGTKRVVVRAPTASQQLNGRSLQRQAAASNVQQQRQNRLALIKARASNQPKRTIPPRPARPAPPPPVPAAPKPLPGPPGTPECGPFLAAILPFVKDVQVIFDIGSRDGVQAAELSIAFQKASVFAFEALPVSAGVCRRNLADFPNCKVVEGAVHTQHGETVKFFPVVSSTIRGVRRRNVGSSSLFKALNQGYPEVFHQIEIDVKTLRLDEFAKANKLDRCDIIWMDLQGAELLALRGMGGLLSTVQAVQMEMSMKPQYDGACTYEELDAFMVAAGFRQLAFWKR